MVRPTGPLCPLSQYYSCRPEASPLKAVSLPSSNELVKFILLQWVIVAAPLAISRHIEKNGSFIELAVSDANGEAVCSPPPPRPTPPFTLFRLKGVVFSFSGALFDMFELQ